MKSVLVVFFLLCILVPAYCFADETLSIDDMDLSLGMTKATVDGLIAKNGYTLKKDEGTFYNIFKKQAFGNNRVDVLHGSVAFNKNKVSYIQKTRYTDVKTETSNGIGNSFQMADVLLYLLSQKNPAQAVISSNATHYADHKTDEAYIHIGKRTISILITDGGQYAHQVQIIESIGEVQ